MALQLSARAQQTVFETSNGLASATYAETIRFYEQIDKASNLVSMHAIGQTDAGYPLHVVTVSANGNADPAAWHKEGKLIVMVLNGIHPGEPDGIDASQLLVRDIVAGKVKLPQNLVLGIVPVYNIGGALNRGSYSRANQQGPLQYGFRGNAQNLDLNRDFTKADSYNARAFAKAFHWLDPHILIDNHVSDGADFQHVFTLLTTQYDKLGEPLGSFLRQNFEPALYQSMKAKGWDVFPYVNFDAYDLSRGMTQFYDPPRYSSGYAALFGCMGFVPETHMLKPFKQRVASTYDFMLSVLEQGSKMQSTIVTSRNTHRQRMQNAQGIPMTWKPGRSNFDTLSFLGYQRDTVISDVTGLPRMRYNRAKPFTGPVKFYSYFTPESIVSVPAWYVLPQGWHAVAERLQEQGIAMQPLKADTAIEVTVYHIDNFNTPQRAYEKHYRHNNTSVKKSQQVMHFLKGDWLINLRQPGIRYLVEMLEPTGDDSFFAWNYFDAILQQKEGYSNYRWEDVAAQWLQDNPALRQELEEKKKADTAFAGNANAMLDWVYKKSPYYEPAHMRYPVYRIEK